MNCPEQFETKIDKGFLEAGACYFFYFNSADGRIGLLYSYESILLFGTSDGYITLQIHHKATELYTLKKPR
jgi:hypothetical protein